MKKFFMVAAAVAVFAGNQTMAATVFDFETDLDGFAANGGGITVAAGTTGVTSGSTSLALSVVTGATFVGALTGVVPAPVNDPPGLDSLTFDLTIDQQFTGNFANLGITIFGATQPGAGQQFGLQAQFADVIAIEAFAPGTYTVAIDLDSATNPLTFQSGQSFNDIFGTVGSGANDLIPTGFQFFVNKSGTAPISFFIDNVRTVSAVPEPGSLAILALGALGLGIRHRRSRKNPQV